MHRPLARVTLGGLAVVALTVAGVTPALAAPPPPGSGPALQVALTLTGSPGPALAFARSQALHVDRVTSHVVLLSAPASRAAAAFGAQLHPVSARWSPRGIAHYLAPVTPPAVPAALRGAVSAVVGLDNRPLFRQHSVPIGYDGSNLASAYAATGLTGGGAGITVGTIQFAGWNPSDASVYANAAGITLGANQITTVSISGTPTSPDGSGGDQEVALDVEAILATAPQAAQRVYVTTNTVAGAVAAYSQVADDAAAGLVQVVSTSWGACEPAYGSNLPQLADPINRTVAAGATVFAASGDAGAYDCASPNSPDGRLAVDFPASLPSVVAVGGTTLTDNGGSYAETGWGPQPTSPTSAATAFPGKGSGGGVSEIYPRPSYQSGVAGSYRAVPDVSALGDATYGFGGYAQSTSTGWVKFGGTSFGAPMWAGQLANALSTAGRTQGIGDIHAALYANPGAFRDVTSGTNAYYSASPGYDEVTGLGSPQWSALYPALGLTTPAPSVSASPSPSASPTPSPSATPSPSPSPSSSGTPVAAGGTATSPAGPLVASVTSPNAGNISFTPLGSPPAPIRMAGLSSGIRISAPSGPLTVSFRIDPSLLPDGALPGDVRVVHDGSLVAPCGAGGSQCASANTLVTNPLQITVSGGSSGDWTFAVDRVSRLAGTDRIGTAVAVSQATFVPGAAQSAVLARSDGYADALAGTPLAAAKQGPLLLTGSTTLAAPVAAELSRAVAAGGTVYLLGGTGALSAGVADQVSQLGFTVVRLAGADRYATATAIAGAINPSGPLLVTTGLGFPDALAAGAAAAQAGGAVLLTAGSAPAAATQTYLAAHPNAPLYAVGGPAAQAYPKATPVFGSDRYATALEVAQRFFPGATAVGLASGASFPDALAAGPVLGAGGVPLLLTAATLPPGVSSYLGATKPLTVHLFGGTAALDASLPDQVWNLIG